MGLFSFLKNAGASLFKGKEVEAPSGPAAPTGEDAMKALAQARANMLKSSIESLGLNVKDMELVVEDDMVTVFGEVETSAEKEKVILAIGNVEGIATVDDRLSVVAPPEPASIFHTVEKGDTLSKIAKAVYGDPMKYPVIFEANKPMLSDPDKIYPGQVLRIPKMS